MSTVYNDLLKRNIITENNDGSVSTNYRTLLEDEIKSTQLKEEEKEATYKTYNIIAISTFIIILIVTFIFAFKIGKKHNK